MSEWEEKPPGLAALLESARTDGPSDERLARVRKNLETELGRPLTPAPSARPGWLGAATLGAVVVGVIVVAWLTREPTREVPETPSPVAEAPVTETPAPAVERAPAPEPTVSEPEPTRPEPEPEPVAVRVPRAPEPETPPEPATTADDDSGSTLREEIALLERAIAARDRGDVNAARAALEAHQDRFPSGVLTPERERLTRELDAHDVAPGPAGADPLPVP